MDQRCLTVSGLSSPGAMASWHDVLEMHGIKKTPPGKLSSKADFFYLLYGSVDGNFSGLGPDFHRSALLTISAIFFAKWWYLLDLS